MMAVKNKAEIKLYYEMNNEKALEVAKKFNISYRTLAHWIKTEKWQKGKNIKPLMPSIAKDKILNKEFLSVQEAKKAELGQKIKEGLGEEASMVNEIVLNNLIEHSTDKLLLEAMGVNFIQKNIALTALVAKNELMRMVALKDEKKAEPMLIACAEKVAKIFCELKISLYGKENALLENEEQKDYTKLSSNELNYLEYLKAV